MSATLQNKRPLENVLHPEPTAEEPAAKKPRVARVSLENALQEFPEPMDKEVRIVKKSIQSQIDNTLKWKSSFKWLMNSGKIKGGRAITACPNPRILEAIFEHFAAVQKKGQKFVIKIESKDMEDSYGFPFSGKTYRYGASAELMGPISASWNDGSLTLNYKYTVA